MMREKTHNLNPHIGSKRLLLFILWYRWRLCLLMLTLLYLYLISAKASHQRDKVSEGQLDLNLHFVFRMNHRPNFLVVVFEQVLNKLSLLVALGCTKKERKNDWGSFVLGSTFQKHLHGSSILPEILLITNSNSLKCLCYPKILFVAHTSWQTCAFVCAQVRTFPQVGLH